MYGNFQMASTSDNNYIETSSTRPVNEAVKEYRVIEDGAFAHYLQEREIEYHHACNVDQRRTVMDDIRAAKELQDEEDRRARILTMDQQEKLKDLDGRLAEEIQEEIVERHELKERERQRREEKDNIMAKKLLDREKRRERRQQDQDRQLAAKMNDLNAFPERNERRRELSDEEIAKRLQEEEKNKLKKNEVHKQHIKTVVEMQDEELARFIHERDREEAEMMERQHRPSKKKQKMPRGKAPGNLPPEDERRYNSGDRNEPRTQRMEKSSHAPQSSREHRLFDAKSKEPYHAPRRPRQSGEDPSHRSYQSHASNEPMNRRRHTTKEFHHQEEFSPSRSKSEKPHRPPPPNTHANHEKRDRENPSTDRVSSSSGRNSRQSHPRGDALSSDDPWKRFPQETHRHSYESNSAEDIAYGDGFARLTEQEAWYHQQNIQEDQKKKNKGDCKQQ